MSFSPIKDLAKTAIGFAAEIAIPSLAREVDAGEKTGRMLRIKKAIVHSRIRRASWSGDETAAKKAIDDWWKSEVGDDYYDSMAGQKRLDGMFLGDHYPLVERLKEYCAANPNLHKLVEVGCGDGLVLNHMSKELPAFSELLGLDISERIIERNAQTFAENSRIRFSSANVIEWIKANNTDNTVLMSYGGVMEYLTEDELLEVYKTHLTRENAVVALGEPLDTSFDPKTETSSRFIGTLHVYHCHNYADILRRAGYDVIYETYLDLAGWPWTLVIGVKPDAAH